MKNLIFGLYCGLVTLIVVSSLLLLLRPREPYDATNRVQAVYHRLALNAGEHGIPGKVVILPIKDINAYTDGENIGITKGLLAIIKNDDQLAMILAHELAHLISQDWKNKDMSQSIKEAHADKLGAFILMRSGFDICKASEVFQLFLARFGDTAEVSSHPDFAYRYNQVSLPSCRG